MSDYRSNPVQSSRMPKGIPYIIGNEVAERFSFYGMKAILTVFMTKHLMDSSGAADTMNDEEAKTVYHLFTAAAYFFPLLGSLISDILWGKYKTILILSMGYCIGHACLAMGDTGIGSGIMEPKFWLFTGLVFIAIGAGGIKPCVSAHVGDQFGSQNQHLVSNVYSWFYFAINVGAATSTLLTPVLLAEVGPWAAFGLPGILMAMATFVFWMGRKVFIHVPPGGIKQFTEETFSPEGRRALINLSPLFLLFIPMFWALFDQTGSAWVLQAMKMDRQFGIEWLPSQIQAANPLFILTLIPVFAYIVYPAMGKFFKVTPLRKIGLGLFLTAVAFSVTAMIETNVRGGDVSAATSTATTERMQNVKILDGEAGPGWSSADAPSAEVAQELVIRLRERVAWNINEIVVDPDTTFEYDELELTLEKLAGTFDKKVAAEAPKIEQIESILDALDDEVDITTLLAEARTKLESFGLDASCLDIAGYRPSRITVFGGDFSSAAIPGLRSELELERAELQRTIGDDDATTDDVAAARARLAEVTTLLAADSATYHSGKGWTALGTMDFQRSAGSQTVTFNAMPATHVLVRIEGNHGAPRVKLGEVEVKTTDSIPNAVLGDDGLPTVGNNVAALGFKPNIAWQILAYLLLTAAEVMVSITSLEFAYTQAPKKMKSFIMGIYFLGVSIGNFFTAGVNAFIQNDDGSVKLAGASYYWFFTGLMLVTAIIYIAFAMSYKGQRFVQGDDNDMEAESEMH